MLLHSLSPTLAYSRLVIVFFSWYFVLDQPQIFTGMYLLQHSLYIIQVLLCTPSSGEKELSKQLRILAARLATSILLFAVMRQSLDHASHFQKEDIDIET